MGKLRDMKLFVFTPNGTLDHYYYLYGADDLNEAIEYHLSAEMTADWTWYSTEPATPYSEGITVTYENGHLRDYYTVTEHEFTRGKID